MSTTVSTTEVKALVPPKAVTKLKTEEKPRLVRTSSIDKIRRFNSFICSQQYYLLPALLSWLKSSQSGLQSSTEKTIFLFRSIFFNTFFYKLQQMGFKSAGFGAGSLEKLEKEVKGAVSTVISNFYQNFSKCFESTFLLVLAVYAACVLVIVQFLVSLYLIYCAVVPYGFFFLVGCMGSIQYLCYKTTITSSQSKLYRRNN